MLLICFLAFFEVFWVKVIEGVILQFNFISYIVYMYSLLTESIKVTGKNSMSLFRFRINRFRIRGRLMPELRCTINTKDNKRPFVQETKMRKKYLTHCMI